MDYTFQDFKEYISYLKTLTKEELANIQTIVIDTDPIPSHIICKEERETKNDRYNSISRTTIS